MASSEAEIRFFRDQILESDEECHTKICNINDFYSLSMFKDLLFHAQEHTFTIPLIRACLKQLGLKFCGFESRKIISHFKLTYTKKDDLYDLDKWHSYEEDNPNAFSVMYQFWCQKIDNR